MLEHCKKSCGGCDEGSPDADCVDLEATDDCEYWVGIGECENNPDWMNEFCKKSCDMCPCPTTPKPTEPDTTTATTSSPYDNMPEKPLLGTGIT